MSREKEPDVIYDLGFILCSLMFKMLTIPFKKDTCFLIVGGSNSGKSTWIFEFIKNLENNFEPGQAPVDTHYFYGCYQKAFTQLEGPKTHFTLGIPTSEDIDSITSDGKSHLIVLDDLDNEVFKNERLTNLFTRDSHHRGLTVFLVTQNLFNATGFARVISRNTQYFVFSNSPRNLSTVISLSRQVYPKRSQILIEAYEDVIKTPWQTLVFDLNPSTPEAFRIRSNVFAEVTTVYAPLK